MSKRMGWAVAAIAAAIMTGCQHQAPVESGKSAIAMPAGAYILTPPSPHAPRITGARIYGQRPGRPFLFTVTATGDRPMHFHAANLPAGLTLDSATGHMTGSVSQPGDYTIHLTATNSKGSAQRDFKIVIGDKIALTPPMGWNSWNCWAASVDQEKVLRSAHAMVASGLINHGWTYINIDDTWQGARDPQTHALLANEKFPDMRNLAGAIHSMGLKAGIYSTPWVTSYAGYPGGSSQNPDGAWTKPTTKRTKGFPWAVGQYHSMAADARQWADWGFDYLKYDWKPIDVPNVTEMHDALLNSGRDIVYSLSNSAPFPNAADWARLANSWRTTGDIRDNWWSITGIGFSQNPWTPFAGPGHWNDPDMLVVGYVGWGPQLHASNLSPDEQYTHISLWCLLSAPLLLGNDLDRLDPFTLSLLTNDEVLAIDQDPLGREATLVSTQGPEVEIPRTDGHPGPSHKYSQGQVWCKELEDGSRAIGLFNLGNSEMTVTAAFSNLHIQGKQLLRDLWRQKNLGTFSTSYQTKVPSHGVVLLKLSPSK